MSQRQRVGAGAGWAATVAAVSVLCTLGAGCDEGLVVGAAEGLVGLYWDPQISIAAVYLVLVLMLALKPSGLAGVRHA